MTIRILQGDCREVLRTFPDESVHCIVTSPPYWGLRDYGVAGQLGLEASHLDYVDAMVGVFLECRRVLRSDGTLWLNLGDSYAHSLRQSENKSGDKQNTNKGSIRRGFGPIAPGLKEKDLCGIPWRVAFALQSDGWWLRQDIIWSKPNPMPESVTDRCTKAHEYVFLMSKSERYYYDQDVIREEPKPNSGLNMRASKHDGCRGDKVRDPYGDVTQKTYDEIKGANRRSVWEIGTSPFPEAHFATFPPDLIEPCILAGCPEGGTVLDPFGGAGTTGLVADRLRRNAILIELNPEYAAMAERRIRNDAPLFADVALQ